jgi:hypothetical protein
VTRVTGISSQVGQGKHSDSDEHVLCILNLNSEKSGSSEALSGLRLVVF